MCRCSARPTTTVQEKALRPTPPAPRGAAQAAGSPRWLLLSKSVCKLNLKASKATACVEGRLLQQASLTEDEPFPNLQVGQELGA